MFSTTSSAPTFQKHKSNFFPMYTSTANAYTLTLTVLRKIIRSSLDVEQPQAPSALYINISNYNNLKLIFMLVMAKLQ